MSDEKLDSIDSLLLPYAFDTNFSAKLDEIINAKPRNIARNMSEENIYLLADYLPFVRNEKGTINIKHARQEIEKFLLNHPYFLRENTKETCKLIICYYDSHPELPRPKLYVPNWYKSFIKNASKSPTSN